MWLRLTILIMSVVLAPFRLEAQASDAGDLWTVFHSATEDRAMIAPALAQVRAARPADSGSLPVGNAALLDAYEGALRAMSATTTAWPPSKLSRARAGLSLLDGAVDAAPEDPEVRYLRLLICHHLPSFFLRRDTARSDAAALAAMLLSLPPDEIPQRQQGMAAFLESTDYLPDTTRAAVQRRFSSSP